MVLPLITTLEAAGGEHPEMKSGEIFLSNGNDAGFAQLSYQSKRKGEKAYDQQGRHLPGLIPIFVNKAEYLRLRSQ
ncbi:MAG: hypothetical protein KBB77_02325 [Candidatus Moranbacteria bacterium]|jgi:hypothetical protein|nr:hypothetical protein [Candidatus Moranbacteria bacterium]